MPDGMSTLAPKKGQKHHYIPKFYLKQWVGPDGRLCEFSKPRHTVIAQMKFPDATAYERGLNTFEMLPLALTDFLEHRFFMRIDDRAAAVLVRLLNDDVEFDAPTRTAWARCLMTLIHRTPEGFARIRKNVAEGIPAEIGKLRPTYESNRQPGDPQTFEQFKKSLTDTDFQGITLQVLAKVMNSELLGTQLINMRWGVIRAKSPNYPMLTSDRPLIMSDGIGHEGGFILMPISSTRAFVAANNVVTANTISREPNFAARVNDFMCRQARRFVYGSNDAQLRFISNRLGKRAKWSPME